MSDSAAQSQPFFVLLCRVNGHCESVSGQSIAIYTDLAEAQAKRDELLKQFRDRRYVILRAIEQSENRLMAVVELIPEDSTSNSSPTGGNTKCIS